jgi:hypothetical protein
MCPRPARQITQDGYANIDVVRTWHEVLWPITMGLSLSLFIPYFIAVVYFSPSLNVQVFTLSGCVARSYIVLTCPPPIGRGSFLS